MQIYLDAALEHVHKYRQYREDTFVYGLSKFPTARIGADLIAAAPIELPVQPVLTVDSVTYQDENDQQQTFVDWRAVTAGVPGYIMPGPGSEWPTAIADAYPENVQITFSAGDSTNKIAQEATLVMVKTWFDTRGAVTSPELKIVPMQAEALLGQLYTGNHFTTYGVC